MANPKIVPKKSTIADKVPLTTDLASGEVAINYADQVWYGKHPSTGNVVPIGAPYQHSHDQLLSIDKNNELELTNSGSLVLSVGANSTTLTPTSTTNRTVTIPDKTGPLIVGSTADSVPVNGIRCLTQGEYDALGSYDANTLYFIK